VRIELQKSVIQRADKSPLPFSLQQQRVFHLLFSLMSSPSPPNAASPPALCLGRLARAEPTSSNPLELEDFFAEGEEETAFGDHLSRDGGGAEEMA
jgi:hypothetical protein